MKKRLLSLFCAFALVAGLLPATALADAPENQVIYVGGKEVTSGGYWTTDSDGNVTASTAGETPTDNYIHYDAENNVLTLHDATIKNELEFNESIEGGTFISGSAIGVFNQSGNAELTISLVGTNTIANVGKGIFVLASSASTGSSNLTIQGDGSLNASASQTGIWVQSNGNNAALCVENAEVTASADGAVKNGVLVQAKDGSDVSLTVNGGSLTASVNANIWFQFGSGVSGSGTPTVTVSNNAIVRANGGIANNSSTSIQYGTGNEENGGIVFDGSAGTVYGSVTLQDDLEIKSGETLTVPDGSKLDCNNNLTNKGTILVETGGTVSGNLSGGTTVTTPNITAQPTGQTVTEGSTAEFSVIASAGDSETLTYQWQQSTDSGSSWTNIESATSASYTTGTTTSMSGYQYRCVVTGTISRVSVVSAAATLTVQAKPAPVSVTGVSLDKATLELYTGDAATLTATVQPSNATNQNVTWQSDNANVATVEGGAVTAVAAGDTTITVQTQDGNYTATCKVTVTQRSPSGSSGSSGGSSGGSSTPSKTPSQQAADKIESAKDGATVEITLKTGKTTLDKEVFETLAGRDVTLEISLPGGVSWTVNGLDIPANANLSDVDMGVSMNTSTIPVDVFNAITGEVDTIQISLKHNGEFGFTLTLTAPLGKEYADLWANLYHYDAGALKFEAAARIGRDGTVSLPFTHASEYAIIIDDRDHTPKAFPFVDVKTSDWYYDAVDFVYQNELMNGTSAYLFEPDGTMTRAMLVTILHRQAGEPQVNYLMPFTDVAAGEWYTEAVRWAAAEGIVTGTGATTFEPDAPITREQFAAILYRYAQQSGADVSVGESTNILSYADAQEVSEYAVPAMQWACGAGVVQGSGANLNPQASATRAEAAAMLMRFIQTAAE
nr:S-layer homology domain-containing protein [uncultured Agathobaculum sp.]